MVPKLFPEGADETSTWFACSSVSSSWPACGGMTTVKFLPLVSVPVLVPPSVLASWTVFT